MVFLIAHQSSWLVSTGSFPNLGVQQLSQALAAKKAEKERIEAETWLKQLVADQPQGQFGGF